MMGYYEVSSFKHISYDKTKVKPKKMKDDFVAMTNDIKNLVAAINTYSTDWGQVGTKVSSSDWSSYADGIGQTADDIAEALSKSASNLMNHLNELVDSMSGFSTKEAGQIDSAKTAMSNCLSTLSGLGGKR